jgi:hypothetical protein
MSTENISNDEQESRRMQPGSPYGSGDSDINQSKGG